MVWSIWVRDIILLVEGFFIRDFSEGEWNFVLIFKGVGGMGRGEVLF